jgi:hypothetical protein
MPVIEIPSTQKGLPGNKMVPARTKGVLGISVNPRRRHTTRYAVITHPPNFAKNIASPAGVNDSRWVRKNPRQKTRKRAQRAIMIFLEVGIFAI